jgi:transposase
MHVENHHSLEELKSILASSSGQMLKLRIQAVVHAMEGLTGDQIAKHLGWTRKTVFKWVGAYNLKELDGLSQNVVVGRPRKLAQGDIQSLLTRIESETDQENAYLSKTLARLQQLLKEEYQVEYSLGRLYDLVRLGHSTIGQIKSHEDPIPVMSA